MTIKRSGVGPRLSQSVSYGDTVYLAGQVADSGDADVTVQAKEVLAKIDQLLAEAGSDKSKMLWANVWVSDMEAYFADFNKVWDAWVVPGQTPARAAVEAKLARPNLKVEVAVIAARSA